MFRLSAATRALVVLVVVVLCWSSVLVRGDTVQCSFDFEYTDRFNTLFASRGTLQYDSVTGALDTSSVTVTSGDYTPTISSFNSAAASQAYVRGITPTPSFFPIASGVRLFSTVGQNAGGLLVPAASGGYTAIDSGNLYEYSGTATLTNCGCVVTTLTTCPDPATVRHAATVQCSYDFAFVQSGGGGESKGTLQYNSITGALDTSSITVDTTANYYYPNIAAFDKQGAANAYNPSTGVSGAFYPIAQQVQLGASRSMSIVGSVFPDANNDGGYYGRGSNLAATAPNDPATATLTGCACVVTTASTCPTPAATTANGAAYSDPFFSGFWQ